MKYAVIGGTGVYDLLEKTESITVSTEFGDVEIDKAQYKDIEIAFLPRHGRKHSTPPHKINYLANMKALAKLGVKHIYATAAVGSCIKEYAPGDIVIINDFIDFTKKRSLSYYDGGEDVVHFEMDDPYCSSMRSKFLYAADFHEVDIKGNAVYVCTEGPRFETSAEIKMFKKLGGEVVGMTGVPEVILAKELKMCYSAIGIITNYETGIGEKAELEEIKGSLSKNKAKIVALFLNIFEEGLHQNNCSCSDGGIKV